MKIHELIEALRQCNQEAEVVISVNEQIGDYTWEDQFKPVSGVVSWPAACMSTASKIEITWES